MKLSTISSAEMSIRTPRALCETILAGQIIFQRRGQPVVHVDLDGDEQRIAEFEDRDAVHRQASCPPLFLSGDDSRIDPSRLDDGTTGLPQCNRESIRQRRLRDHVQLDAEMHHGLGDLGPDAADQAIGAHQARRRDRLQQMLRRERIDRGHAGDVDDGDLGLAVHDRLQEIFHHHLRALAVERADQRQSENALPQFDDRGRQLGDLALLADDDFFTAFWKISSVNRPSSSSSTVSRPDRRGDLLRGQRLVAIQRIEQRLLEREDECGGFARRKALQGAATAKVRSSMALAGS